MSKWLQCGSLVLGVIYICVNVVLGVIYICVKKSKISCHTSPADGEIIVKLRKGNKNVLSTQCKDYYKEFVNIKGERPTALYRWEENVLLC